MGLKGIFWVVLSLLGFGTGEIFASTADSAHVCQESAQLLQQENSCDECPQVFVMPDDDRSVEMQIIKSEAPEGGWALQYEMQLPDEIFQHATSVGLIGGPSPFERQVLFDIAMTSVSLQQKQSVSQKESQEWLVWKEKKAFTQISDCFQFYIKYTFDDAVYFFVREVQSSLRYAAEK